MGFFRSVWQDAQQPGRHMRTSAAAAETGTGHHSSHAIPASNSHVFSSDQIQKAGHAPVIEPKQTSSPSAAPDSPIGESFVTVENLGHEPQKASQQQDFESFGTTVYSHASASVEESLSVDPIVGERSAFTHELNNALLSVNSLSLKHDLATGEDINRAASHHTDVRVPEQFRFVRAASVFSRDLSDPSVRVDERNFQYDFGDLDTSRVSGLGAPSEYLQSDKPLVDLPTIDDQINDDKTNVTAADVSLPKPLFQDMPNNNENNNTDNSQDNNSKNIATNVAALDYQQNQAPLSSAINSANNGPLLSEHQRYLQMQAKYQQAQMASKTDVNARQEKAAEFVERTADHLPLQLSEQSAKHLAQTNAATVKEQKVIESAEQASSFSNKELNKASNEKLNKELNEKLNKAVNQVSNEQASNTGKEESMAAFKALEALSIQSTKAGSQQQKSQNTGVHIGRIDVVVSADQPTTRPAVSQQNNGSSAGWASRHYLRRI